MWSRSAQKAPKMAFQGPKEYQDELQVAVTWQLQGSTETLRKHRILRGFWGSQLSKSDSRKAREASGCHLLLPRRDKEDSMQRLRQRPPNGGRKRVQNYRKKGPRNESEMGQNRGPKQGPKMVCESLREPTHLGLGSESLRAQYLCIA